MGMAEIAEVLWRRHLRHNPANPKWADRDRFVLSNGHGSMLLYALLHLTGYDLSIDDLKNFRQLHSKTAGPPEVRLHARRRDDHRPARPGHHQRRRHGAGREVLAAEFNRPATHRRSPHLRLPRRRLPDGRHLARSLLAGRHLGLGKLIAFWDDNGISIDGHVDGWFTDDTPKRFEAYGWHVIRDVDGHDPSTPSNAAIARRQGETDKPTLICCKTIIGKGSPNKQGTPRRARRPARRRRIAARAHIGWNHAPVRDPGRRLRRLGRPPPAPRSPGRTGTPLFAAYRAAFPRTRRRVRAPHAGDCPPTGPPKAPTSLARQGHRAKAENIATRKASQNAIAALAPLLPELSAARPTSPAPT
jgi:transketolase